MTTREAPAAALAAEAAERMRMIGLDAEAAESFEKGGVAHVWERGAKRPPTEEEAETFAKLRRHTGCVPFAAALARDPAGDDVLHVLFVSPDGDEWPFERRELEEMRPLTYAARLASPDRSRYDKPKIKTSDGILEAILP